MLLAFISGCLEGGNITMGKSTPEQKLNKVILGFSRREAITDIGSIRSFQKDLASALKKAPLKLVPEINHFKAWSLLWEAMLLSNRKHQEKGILENLENAEKSFNRAIKDKKSRELFLLGGLIYSLYTRYDEKEREKYYFKSRCCFYMANNMEEKEDSLKKFNFGQHYFTTDEIEILSTYPDFYSGHYSLALNRLESLDVDHTLPEYIMAYSWYSLFMGNFENAVKYMEIFKSPKYRSYYLYRVALNQLRMCYQALETKNPGEYSIDIKVVTNLLKIKEDFFTSNNLIEFSKDEYISVEKSALGSILISNIPKEKKKNILYDLVDITNWPNNYLKLDVESQPSVYREVLYQLAKIGYKTSETELYNKFPDDEYALSLRTKIEDKPDGFRFFTGFFKENKDNKKNSFYIFAANGNKIASEIKLQRGKYIFWLDKNDIFNYFKLPSFELKKDQEIKISVFIDKKEIKINIAKPTKSIRAVEKLLK